MALSLILQNFGTIAIAGLLLRQALSLGASKDEAALDRILADLTDADPVKRLIAVRQMTDLVNQGGFGPCEFCQKFDRPFPRCRVLSPDAESGTRSFSPQCAS